MSGSQEWEATVLMEPASKIVLNSWLLWFPPPLNRCQSLWPTGSTRSDGVSYQDKVIKNMVTSCLLSLTVFLGSLTLGETSCRVMNSPIEQPVWQGFLPEATDEVASGLSSLSSLQMTTASTGILTERPWARIIQLNYSQVLCDRKLVTLSWYGSVTHRNCEMVSVCCIGLPVLRVIRNL